MARTREWLKFGGLVALTLALAAGAPVRAAAEMTPSPEAPATKSGSAIGIGCTFPCVMSTRTAAAAARGNKPVMRPPAMPVACMSKRRRLSCERSANELIEE